VNVLYFCRHVPPKTPKLTIFNWLVMLSYDLSGLVLLAFLVSALLYLTVAAGAVWVAFIGAVFFFTWKPLQEYRKTRAYLRGEVDTKATQRE
jgi:hypothetical protein